MRFFRKKEQPVVGKDISGPTDFQRHTHVSFDKEKVFFFFFFFLFLFFLSFFFSFFFLFFSFLFFSFLFFSFLFFSFLFFSFLFFSLFSLYERYFWSYGFSEAYSCVF